jgi:RNA-directed DNA polymerase
MTSRTARATLPIALGLNRVGVKDIRTLFEYLNPILRGWGSYFRIGNAAAKFRQVDRYATWRLRRLMIKKRGRNLRAGQLERWTTTGFRGPRFVQAGWLRPLSESGVAPA